MRSFVLCLALAVPALSASAAPLNNTNPYPVNKAAKLTQKAQWVRVSFRNSSPRSRTLTIGDNSFNVDGLKTVTLNVIVGSNVHLSSAVENAVNEDLLKVSAADAYSTVVVR